MRLVVTHRRSLTDHLTSNNRVTCPRSSLTSKVIGIIIAVVVGGRPSCLPPIFPNLTLPIPVLLLIVLVVFIVFKRRQRDKSSKLNTLLAPKPYQPIAHPYRHDETATVPGIPWSQQPQYLSTDDAYMQSLQQHQQSATQGYPPTSLHAAPLSPIPPYTPYHNTSGGYAPPPGPAPASTASYR